MADGTVRGAFTLDAEEPIRQLTTIRDRGREANTSLRALGDRMDSLGTKSETMARRVSTSWDATRKAIDVQADRIASRVDELEMKLDSFGRKHVSATVELRGFDRANAQISELEARLDSLGRRSVSSRVSIAGGGMGGGGGASSAGGGGGFGALAGVPWWAAALPFAQPLIGGAGALLGSATSGVLGAGTVGVGAAGSLGVGGALSMGIFKPSLANVAAISNAQDAQQAAAMRYGPNSAQAKRAQSAVNLALLQHPLAAGAATQYSALQNQVISATRPAQRLAYGGISNSIYNIRRAVPQLSRDAAWATSATAGAATNYTRFLAGSGTQGSLSSLTATFSRELPTIERTLENVTTTFLHLSVAATPFFHEANAWVQTWTAGMATASGNTTAVQSKMSGYVTSARDWARLTGATFRTIRDLLNAGAPSGNSMVVSLTDTLNSWDRWIQRNPQKVQTFFQQSVKTVDHVASVIAKITGDVWQLLGYISPIASRLLQLTSLVSGLGPGGIGVGGALLYGAYEGGRGALGGRGPSAAGLAGSFVMGGAGPMRASSRVGGGSVLGESSVSIPAGIRASNLEVARGVTSGGVFLMPGASSGAAAVLARREAAAAARLGGGGGVLSGVRGRLGALVEGSPVAARVADMAGGARGLLGGVLGGAARFALPVLAITSALQGMSTPGNFGSKIVGGVNSFAHMASFGAIPANALQILSGAASPTGSSLRNPAVARSLQAIQTQAGAVRTPEQLRALEHIAARVQVTGISGELPPSEYRKLQAFLTTATTTAAANAGAAGSNSWETAFQSALTRMPPGRAVNTMLGGIRSQFKALGPAGSRALAGDTAAWVNQMELSDPKMRGPLARLMQGIVDDLNRVEHNTTSAFKRIHDQAFYFNGQILTGTQATWGKIGGALTDPMQVAQEKLLGIFGLIQSQALNALTQMGYSRSQARQIVTQSIQGGQNRSNANASLTALSATGKHLSPLSTTPQNPLPKHHARGGMITGTGLLDTVGTPDGGRAAPGEAWIANRHTMNDLSRATIEKYGKTAWQMIQGETRMHSTPPAPDQGIMPGYMRGGQVGAPAGLGQSLTGSMPAMMAAANLIAARRFPYRWGGGHMNFAGPYDCSGAVSAVLHAGGVLGTPETSGTLMNYGMPGPGPVTIFANPSHTYMRLGQRYFGTSGSNPGGGAGWFNGSARAGFVQRHIDVTGSMAGSLASGGGATGALAQAIALRGVSSGLGGIPGAMADRAGAMYAAGMQAKINNRIGATGISAAGFSGGGSNAANQSLGRRMMLTAGWGSDQWPALQALWTQESGWNANAVNPSSGAYGIPQALGHGHPYSLGDAPAQIAWGLNYIRGRYGSPVAAEAHEKANNWYARGGHAKWSGWHARGFNGITNGPTLFGAGEGGRQERVTIKPAHSPHHNATGGRQIIVNFNGPVHIASDKDLEQLGRDVAGKILDALDHTATGVDDKELMTMGAGNGA